MKRLALCILVGLTGFLGIAGCKPHSMPLDIHGEFRVEKTVLAIAKVPGPTENTFLTFERDGTFSGRDWPAWSLVPLTGGRTQNLPSVSGRWKFIRAETIEMQFNASDFFPSGAVLLVSVRKGNPPSIKVPLNPGNEDDFMIMKNIAHK